MTVLVGIILLIKQEVKIIQIQKLFKARGNVTLLEVPKPQYPIKDQTKLWLAYELISGSCHA